MINILVLGHKGMLGHMVCNTLNNSKYEITTINERFPNWDKVVFNNIDFVINCIGAIPQRTKDFSINHELPIWLDQNTNCKIIHPSTDCEGNDSDYGLSKIKATNYIKDHSRATKMIKTSIIGPELNSNVSLLGWFLSQTGKVDGYTKAIWNGVTTLEWAKQCEIIINNWDITPILTTLYSNNVSKFDLLSIIQECYDKKDVIIIPKELGENRSLDGDIKTKDIKEQIMELIQFKNG